MKFEQTLKKTQALLLFILAVCVFDLLPALQVSAQEKEKTPVENNAPDKEKTTSAFDLASCEEFKGFFDFYWQDKTGKVWLRLDDHLDQPFLYVSSLATGLGSNPVGLDRGQLGSTRLVQWTRVGPKVFLKQLNVSFRASSENPTERKAVDDSFADSIIWSGTIKNAEDKQLVDITSLIVRDAHDCVRKLASTGQGTYSFDQSKSYVHLPRTKCFPLNCEFEAAVTLTSNKPGPLARRTAATGNAVTLHQHHSFVQLPSDGFQPRKYDPRCGSFSISYQDYSVPLTENIEKRLITRHRLKKKNPDAVKSEPVEPIIYYLDPGVPSPVREALLDGARWWNEAFEAAGFVDAFQVKVLPDDADPMDVRYNVIQWVHRATRGWSYGQSVVDPRTGEIIKGHVLLGSLRVRQDLTLMGGFLGEKNRGGPNPIRSTGIGQPNACTCNIQSENILTPFTRSLSQNQGLEVALARIRQLSAHEVGHTLGFAHNFAASTYDDRASVMDYPAPRTRIVDGKIDLSDAYGVGLGTWDKFIVKYSYSEFGSSEAEEKGLNKLITETIEKKQIYISDADSRPAGAAHPLSSLWDNGTDPVHALKHEIAVRKLSLEQFSELLIDVGEPMTELEKTFVPIYLHHRYQVDATAKMIGGVIYNYAVRGDGQDTNSPVPVKGQKEAMNVLMATLSPEFLDVPNKILNLIPPRPYSSASDRERFSSRTAPVFDKETAVEVAARLTLGNILQPQRLARVNALNSEEWNQATIQGIIRDNVFRSAENESMSEKQIRRIVQMVYIDHLIKLASEGDASADVTANAGFELKTLQSLLKNGEIVAGQKVHTYYLRQILDRHFDRTGPALSPRGKTETPPGSPIGNSNR